MVFVQLRKCEAVDLLFPKHLGVILTLGEGADEVDDLLDIPGEKVPVRGGGTLLCPRHGDSHLVRGCDGRRGGGAGLTRHGVDGDGLLRG